MKDFPLLSASWMETVVQAVNEEYIEPGKTVRADVLDRAACMAGVLKHCD